MKIMRPVTFVLPPPVTSYEPRDRWPFRRTKGSLEIAAAALRSALTEFVFGKNPYTFGIEGMVTARWECQKCKNSGVARSRSDDTLILRVRSGHRKITGRKCRFNQDLVRIRVIYRPAKSPTLDSAA